MAELNIEKTRRKSDGMSKEIDKRKEKLKCVCPHTNHNIPTLYPQEGSGDKGVSHSCYQCAKEINLRRIPKEKRSEAIDIIDSMIDVIKLNLVLDRPKDKKLLEKVGKLQFGARNIINQYYELTQNSYTNKKKKESNTRWVKSI